MRSSLPGADCRARSDRAEASRAAEGATHGSWGKRVGGQHPEVGTQSQGIEATHGSWGKRVGGPFRLLSECSERALISRSLPMGQYYESAHGENQKPARLRAAAKTKNQV